MTQSFSIELLQQQNKQLREQVEELTETVRQLRAQLAPDRSELPEWLPHLTTLEAKLLSALSTGRLVSKQTLHAMVYDDDPNGGPELKSIDVYICKLRKKIGHRVRIETAWGRGYRLPPEAIELLWPTQREIAA